MRLLVVVALVLCWTSFAVGNYRAKRQIIELRDLNVPELCFEASQCKSKCCKWYDTFSRCAPLQPEGADCQADDGFWDIFDDCPCELGLTCQRSKCVDPNDTS